MGDRKLLVILSVWIMFVMVLGEGSGSSSDIEPSDLEHLTSSCGKEFGQTVCPTLFLLGAQKCGTTSMSQWISLTWTSISRPTSVRGRTVKEVHFFDVNWGKGVKWYTDFFPKRIRTNQISMDATPGYFRHSQVPARMRQLLGKNLQFMLIFRDPVKRAFSRYIQIQANKNPFFEDILGAFDEDFKVLSRIAGRHAADCVGLFPDDEAFPKCAHDSDVWQTHAIFVPSTGTVTTETAQVTQLFIDGLYGNILLYWFKYYDPQQFCVILFEHLMEDFSGTLQRFEPCVTRAGGQFEIPKNSTLPQANSQESCDHCQQLSENEFYDLGKDLGDYLYRKGNALTYEILKDHFGYKAEELVDWDAKYRA